MALGSISILGKKTPVSTVLLCVALGVVATLVITRMDATDGGHRRHHGPHGRLRESMVGAPLAYNMQQGVPSSGPAMTGAKGESSSWYSPLDVNSQGLKVPLHEGQLDIFAKNISKPECCSASPYSTSTGCICVTPEQMKYLNKRGGNRTITSLY